LKVAFRFTIIW